MVIYDLAAFRRYLKEATVSELLERKHAFELGVAQAQGTRFECDAANLLKLLTEEIKSRQQ